MKIVKLLIESQADRERLVYALASNGYKVWIQSQKSSRLMLSDDYFVCFEVPEEDISTNNKEER